MIQIASMQSPAGRYDPAQHRMLSFRDAVKRLADGAETPRAPLGVQLLGASHGDGRLTAIARWIAEQHCGKSA